MRTAILGAAASALLGGTLAITPVTSVSSIPAPGGPACANGCDQAGALMMPETAKPSAPSAAPAAQVGEPSSRATPAANLIAPGASATGSSGAHVVPGAASSGGAAAGGAPGAEAPGLAGAPDVPGMDEAAGVASGLTSIPEDANAIQSVWGTIVAVPTSLVGLAGGVAGTVSSLSLSLFYLEYAGLLPKNIGLPSGLGLSSIPGITVPTSLQQAMSELPPGLQSAISGGSVSAAAAHIPGAAAAIRGAAADGQGPLAAIRAAAPQLGGPGPLAAIRGALPQGGLPRPALPATPGWRALPHPHLPGPRALLTPHCIGPHLGPIGACIP
jgi:hypothetical protein